MDRFFDDIVNFIRNMNSGIKITVYIVMFLLAGVFLYLSIRRKNDKHPLAWGWLVLCVLCIAMGVTLAVL